jgi:hypothetical protein
LTLVVAVSPITCIAKIIFDGIEFDTLRYLENLFESDRFSLPLRHITAPLHHVPDAAAAPPLLFPLVKSRRAQALFIIITSLGEQKLASFTSATPLAGALLALVPGGLSPLAPRPRRCSSRRP